MVLTVNKKPIHKKIDLLSSLKSNRVLFHIRNTSFLICIILCFLSGITTISGQQNATLLLNKLKARYQGVKTIKSEVQIQINLPEQEPVTQKMTVYQKGKKFRLEAKEQLIISDGKTVWTYTSDDNRLVLTNAEDSDTQGFNINSPKDMLDNLTNLSSMQRIAGKTKLNGTPLTVIEFKPKDLDSEFFKVKLLVDEKKHAIKQVESFSKDGSRYTLSFDKILLNPLVPDKLFIFDKSKYPNVEVEDLRI